MLCSEPWVGEVDVALTGYTGSRVGEVGGRNKVMRPESLDPPTRRRIETGLKPAKEPRRVSSSREVKTTGSVGRTKMTPHWSAEEVP